MIPAASPNVPADPVIRKPTPLTVPRAAAAALVVHRFAAFGLVALVAVHLAMVIRHQLIDVSPVLRRMWPPVGR